MFSAIISYDELYNAIRNTSLAMAPFVTEGIPSSTKDEELVTIRVKAKDLRHLALIFKNIKV